MTSPERTAFREFPTEELLGELNEVERKNSPATLFVAGDTALLTEAGLRVSVVGTREPTREGLGRTVTLVRELVGRSVVVVSGLAKGVDTAAHRTAIELGGRTIAVLGTPLDVTYPAENRALQHLIMREHLAVSQFAPGTRGGVKVFPMRNRTMALVSDATVIVEAGEGSGTLHQGWEALRLGRPLFLMESLVQRSDLSWPAEMLHYGAVVLTRDNLHDALEEVPRRTHGGQFAF